MVNSIENNAYRILGLSSNSNQKDILKRYKEIINRLKIEDYPEYDFDFSLPKKLRDENSVNDAIKRLQSQKTAIKEYFFWFNINDKSDEKVMKLIKEGNSSQAIEILKSQSRNDTGDAMLSKKNLAVLLCLLLSNKSNNTYLKESLSAWYELLNSDKFWNTFIKRYTSDNDQATNSEIIQDFRNSATKYVSDLYAELHRQHKDNKYIKDFQEKFGVHGERTEKNVLQPIYQSIYENLESFQKVIIEESNGVTNKEIKEINNIIDSINADLSKLKETGSYDDAQSKVVRDHTAEAIRGISILLHNNTLNTENSYVDESIRLLKVAKQISGTESFKSKIQQDLKVIQKNQKFKEEVGEPISEAPSLSTINGIGSKIYGDTLWFVFIFIPIFAISRYSLQYQGDGSYLFYGKLKLHKWQRYWNFAVLALIIIFVAYLFFAPSSDSSYTGSSNTYTPSSDNSDGYIPTYIPPAKQTFSTTDDLTAGYVVYYAFSDADLSGNITLEFTSTLPITVYLVPSEQDYNNFVSDSYYNKYAGCYFTSKTSGVINCDVSTGGIVIYNSNYQSTSYTIKEK